MKFFFAIYLCFGLMMGGLLHDGFAGQFKWDAEAIFPLVGLNLLAVGFGWLLTVYAKKKHETDPGIMSPQAWILGISVSYVVGLAGVLVGLATVK